MVKKSVCAAVLAIGFLATHAFAADSAVDRRESIRDTSLSGTARLEALLETVRAVHAQLDTLESDFVQIKESQLLVESIESRGSFLFASPDRIRWDYRTPNPISLVISDQVMTTWYRDLRQVERANVGKRSDRILRYLGAGTSLDTLLEYFTVSMRVPTVLSEPLHLALTPRFSRVAKRLQSMDLWLDPETFLPARLRYVEGDGDLTEYRFSNLKMNQGLPEERFELKLPQDVEIRVVQLEGRSGAR